MARINFGQQLARRLGASGVPQLAAERDGWFELLPGHLLFEQAGLLPDYLK
ncbi:hypothetical protein [Neisseria weixii]|uniref:hypothetical protein n=1 Tax=Neisseria weixii TaxID=1853276 RepID=UPI0035A06F73